MKLNFEGLMAPVFTPISPDGNSVNLEKIDEYAKYLVDHGIHGALVNGTSGEGMSLTAGERKAAVLAWIKATDPAKFHVQVQVGGTNLQDVLELARHAEKSGAHSLLCLPELFNKPANSQELVEYLALVAAAAPGTPLLYYHNPGYTGVSLDMPSFMSLAGQRIKTFAGIKFTDTDLQMGTQCANLGGGTYTVFLGCDHVMSGAFTLGFNSSIATCLNVMPDLCVRILESVREGKLADARRAQQTLSAAANAITKNGKWVPAMKAAMSILANIDMGPARAPLSPLDSAHIQTMRKDLAELRVL